MTAERFGVTDVSGELSDFADTAAVMMNLDLVIACDTAVAHLAGAVGMPVWVALPFAPDWRWLLDRSDSPWYPTMRLFRQRGPENWPSAFDDIRQALLVQLQQVAVKGQLTNHRRTVGNPSYVGRIANPSYRQLRKLLSNIRKELP